jgi:hypothetical protein
LSEEEDESEASDVENVVVHSGSTILSQSKPKEITKKKKAMEKLTLQREITRVLTESKTPLP